MGADKIKGGDGNDVILGGDGSDKIDGGKGNDFIDGGAGADRIKGGDGDDSIDGGDGDDRIDGGKGNDVLAGGARAGDIKGGKGDDSILGGDGGDLIRGGQGGDTIDGGAGADVIFGDGSGKGPDDLDIAAYRTSASGVTADLQSGGADDGLGGSDTLIEMEALYGSNFADTLLGDTGSPGVLERFRGYRGDDTIDGRGGFDEIDFRNDPGAIVIDFEPTETGYALATDGWGDTDSSRNIEAVRG